MVEPTAHLGIPTSVPSGSWGEVKDQTRLEDGWTDKTIELASIGRRYQIMASILWAEDEGHRQEIILGFAEEWSPCHPSHQPRTCSISDRLWTVWDMGRCRSLQ